MFQRLKLLCVAMLLLSYAYFYSGRSWNQNSHFNLTRAIVEQHTLKTDSYHQNTGDKAFFNGHYYSDKAPGLSFAAVPIWATIQAALEISDKSLTSERARAFGLYMSQLGTVALPTVTALSLLFSVAVKMGASASGAAFGVLSLGLATPIWTYATLFWGHAAAGSFLVFAFIAALNLRKSTSHALWLGLAVGLSGGWATLIEYPAAPAAALLAGYALCNAWLFQRKMVPAVAVGIFFGAAINILILCIYNYSAFGSMLAISYKYNVNFPEMGTGFFGTTRPKLDVIRTLLFGWERGLVLLAPILIVVPAGIWILWRKRRLDCLILSGIPLYYLLFNASYVDWNGGYSYGPRYLAAGLFFLAPSLALVWTVCSPRLRAVLLALVVTGATFALIAQATTSMPPTYWSRPIGNLIQAFLANKIPMHNGTNAGILLGLDGKASLLPLLLLWLAAALFLWRMSRRSADDTKLQNAASQA